MNTETTKHRNELLALALEANPKKTTQIMRDSEGGRCCLCVARDVAKEHGLELPETEPRTLPERKVGEWFGWGCCDNPHIEYQGDSVPASALNDGKGGRPELSHKEIAQLFRDTYCR